MFTRDDFEKLDFTFRMTEVSPVTGEASVRQDSLWYVKGDGNHAPGYIRMSSSTHAMSSENDVVIGILSDRNGSIDMKDLFDPIDWVTGTDSDLALIDKMIDNATIRERYTSLEKM